MGDMDLESRPGAVAGRRYFYATGLDGVIRAYTREEWGMGGAKPSGNAYGSYTVAGRVVVAALMTVPAIVSPVLLVRAVAVLNLGMALAFLAGTVLFTAGWVLCVRSLVVEFVAGKLRRSRGLPKPRFGVTDDQARAWFEVHPGPEVTRANFPDSSRPF